MKYAGIMKVTTICAGLVAAWPALAAGGDESKPPSCTSGKVWDQQKKQCVPKSSMLDDESLYQAGRALAHSGDYEEAIELLKRVRNAQDPRVLNYLGYAHRKAGHMEDGMNYYRQALAIDPDFVLARSYMGQALVEQGKRREAMIQLAEIRQRTGPVGIAYAQLRDTIYADRGY